MNVKKEFWKKLLASVTIPFFFLLAIWIVRILEWFFEKDINFLGILPQSFQGIPGIFTAPFIHVDFKHLISNSASAFILMTAVFFFYPKVALRVLLGVYLITGFTVWFFAREVYHVGASGIVYGLAFFLFFSGVFRRDNKALALALLVIFFYGGLVWGVFPIVPGVSWESHLFGGVSGVIMAYAFRNVDLPPRIPPSWELEEQEEAQRLLNQQNPDLKPFENNYYKPDMLNNTNKETDYEIRYHYKEEKKDNPDKNKSN